MYSVPCHPLRGRHHDHSRPTQADFLCLIRPDLFIKANLRAVMQIKVDARARKLDFLRAENLINLMLTTGYPVDFLCK